MTQSVQDIFSCAFEGFTSEISTASDAITSSEDLGRNGCLQASAWRLPRFQDLCRRCWRLLTRNFLLDKIISCSYTMYWVVQTRPRITIGHMTLEPGRKIKLNKDEIHIPSLLLSSSEAYNSPVYFAESPQRLRPSHQCPSPS